jgi:uncharacterized protein
MAALPAIAYPVRHPKWTLTYVKPLAADISAMVTEVGYSDHKAHRHGGHAHALLGGAEADEIEVTLEDRDRRWQGPWFPARGDVVSLTIGYDGEQQLDCGQFQVDELELKGPPDAFHLKCIAAGIKPSLRTPRSAAYESSTLLDVANQVAQRHSMTVTGAPQNVNVTWARISQRNETDLHFLRRLAIAHGYDFSIRGTQLVFYSRTALEDQAPVLTVTRMMVKSFQFKSGSDQVYKNATVAYHDPHSKKLIAANASDNSAPTGDDLHIVTRCETPQQASLKAASALHDANMYEVTGRLETEGTPLLVAGVNLDVSGFGNFDGTYHIESSPHRLERSGGYTTEIEMRQLATS